jgi:DNA-binding transcriptional ArsR family regulator
MSDSSASPSRQEPLTGVAASGSFDPTLLARFFRVLGDPTRLRLLTLLLERDQTVSELVEALSAPQGRVSTHLGCLRWCGFVTAHRAGRQVLYTIADARVRELLTLASTMMHDYAAGIASCGVIR